MSDNNEPLQPYEMRKVAEIFSDHADMRALRDPQRGAIIKSIHVKGDTLAVHCDKIGFLCFSLKSFKEAVERVKNETGVTI